MNFITRVGVLLYVIVILLLCAFIILFGQQHIDIHQVFKFLYIVYNDYNLRMMISYVGLFVLIINYILYRKVFVGLQKEKTIAFDNPSGRVSVSLIALDDLIKRKALTLSEVKDVRSTIKAARKGLQVKIKLTLRTETNIPAITTKLQQMITTKIQDTIGIEESINVSIFIGKIIPEKVTAKKAEQKEDGEDKAEANVPFQGYRA